MDTKFLADTKMADSKRELEMQKASFNQEVNTKVRRRNDGGDGRAGRATLMRVSPESRGSAGLRAAGGQGAAEDPNGGDRNRGGAEEEADLH